MHLYGSFGGDLYYGRVILNNFILNLHILCNGFYNCKLVLISTQHPQITCCAIDKKRFSIFVTLAPDYKIAILYVVMMCTVCDNFCKNKICSKYLKYNFTGCFKCILTK